MGVLVLGCKDFPPFKYSDDVGGIEVFLDQVLPRLKNNFYVLTRKFKNASKYERMDNVFAYRVAFVNTFYLKTFTFNLLSFFKAIKLRKEYSLIWAHEPVAGFFAFFLSLLLNKPYILHIHSRGSKEPGPFLRRFGLMLMESFAYFGAKKVIFVAKTLQNEILKSRLIKGGIYVPIALDYSKFKNAKPNELIRQLKNKRKKIILFVGRLHPVKGIDILIKAFCKLGNKKDLVLLIVGDGPKREEYEKLTKKLGLSDKLIFTGAREDIETIMPFVDLFVLPSFSEGMPHTILEAIVCKLPIIATGVGDVPLLIDNIYLIKPNQVKELANKINLVLTEEHSNKSQQGDNIKKDFFRKYQTKEVVKGLKEMFSFS